MTTDTRSMDERMRLPREITIKLSSRSDGGLRICSDDLPGFIMSGADIPAMLRDLPKAIAVLIEHGGLRRTQSEGAVRTEGVDDDMPLNKNCPCCGEEISWSCAQCGTRGVTEKELLAALAKELDHRAPAAKSREAREAIQSVKHGIEDVLSTSLPQHAQSGDSQ